MHSFIQSIFQSYNHSINSSTHFHPSVPPTPIIPSKLQYYLCVPTSSPSIRSTTYPWCYQNKHPSFHSNNCNYRSFHQNKYPSIHQSIDPPIVSIDQPGKTSGVGATRTGCDCLCPSWTASAEPAERTSS